MLLLRREGVGFGLRLQTRLIVFSDHLPRMCAQLSSVLCGVKKRGEAGLNIGILSVLGLALEVCKSANV